MMNNQDKKDRLYALLAKVDNVRDIQNLLEDLCTKKEVINMAERLYAAELLIQGNTYNQVMELSDISSATLSRVSQCVQYGEGYSKLLK